MDGKFEFIEGMLFGIGLTYVIFEIGMNLNDQEDDTTNAILYKASTQQLFFIPFALGAIGGHLFLGTTVPYVPAFGSTAMSVGVLAGLCTILFLIGLWRKRKAYKPVGLLVLSILLFAGFFYGHFLWSMNIKNN